MARITPAPPERFAAVADIAARWTQQKGYPPNSWLTMVRKPNVFRAYRTLHTAVMIEEGEVPKALKFMIAQVVSDAAGDGYCAVHNAENAARLGGVSIEKIRALAQFRSSPLFSASERAALELAAAAGRSPSAVEDAHFDALRDHYSDDAMTEIVAVLALLGWLNRWCQTTAPALEPDSRAFMLEHLASSGSALPDG